MRRLDTLSPLTVIRSLPGTGKTTLAASWATARQRDGDIVSWFNAADTASPRTIINALRTPPSETTGVRIVVIDDAHYLTAPGALSALIDALSHTPHLHLVICTRTAHDITRLAHQAGLETNALTGAHLRITAAQIPAFANSWGHYITAEHARHLHHELGGWLSALRHALDHANPARDPYGTRAAASFLRDDILPLIDDTRALIAATVVAAVGHITEPLLRTVFHPRTGAGRILDPCSVPALLENLTHHGFLEPLHAEDSPSWRYPTLLASTLTAALEAEHPGIARDVHQVTATWLAAQDTLEEDGLGGLIVAHARAAGDWALLARMWNDHGLCLTIHHPQQAHAAYYDTPDPVIAQHPELALASSVMSALGPDIDDSRRRTLIRNYREAGWVIHALPLPPRSPSILETTAQMISARHHGDVLGAHRIATEYAQQHLHTKGSRNGLLHCAWFKLQWALSSFAAREASEAIDLLGTAAHYARVVGADAIVSAAAAQLALMNAVAGHTKAAGEYLAEHHSIHTANQWLHHPAYTAGQIAQGMLTLDTLDPSAHESFDIAGAEHLEDWALIAWARTQHALLFDDPVLAMTEVNRLTTLHHHTLDPHSSSQRIIDRTVADLYLALGEFNRCQRHIQDAGAHELILAVPRVRLAFITGDYATARTIAATYAWDPFTTLRDRIDLLILKAAAAFKMGDTGAAKVLFSRAHHLAADTGTLIPYAMLPAGLRDELLDLIGNPLATDELARIRACHQPYPEHGELVVLSPRETVVLYAMVEHDTLADIADTLVVSLNTIKKQAHAVHSKLGVHDRQAALLRAHRLGLLPEPTSPARGPAPAVTPDDPLDALTPPP